MALDLKRMAAAIRILEAMQGAAPAPAPQYELAHGSYGGGGQSQFAGGSSHLGGGGGIDLFGDIGKALSYPVHAAESTYRYSAANMLANMLHDKSPASAVKATPFGGHGQGDVVGNIFDPNKQYSGYDIVAGKKKGSKGASPNVQGLLASEAGTKKGALGVQASQPVLFGAGLGVDLVADPLNLLGGAGIAAHGPEAVANAAAKTTSRLATAKAAEEAIAAGEDAAKVAEALKTGEGAAKLLDKYKNTSSVATILSEGKKVVASARRTGVSKLSREQIATFLTNDAGKQLTKRGLTIRGAEHVIPLTDRGPAAALGESFAGAKAALADKTLAGPLGKLFQTDREIVQQARSGDPSKAYEAVATLMQKGAARTEAIAHEGTFAHDYVQAVKGMTPAEKELLPHALGGDAEAIAQLGDKFQPVRDVLDKMHGELKKAGSPAGHLEDYSPRVLTPEGRKLLKEIGGLKGGQFSPLRFMEKARRLQDGETFLGEVLHGNPAEVTRQVNDIALRALEKVDPQAAKEMAGFFDPNVDSAMAAYIRGASNRIASMNAAQRLHEMGIGSGSRTTLKDPAAQEKLAEVADQLAALEQRQVTLGERADQLDATQRATAEHLLGQRAGQLEQSVSGAPVTSPLTDAQTAGLAGANLSDAGAAVEQAKAALADLEAKDVARAGQRGAAAENLRGKIAELRAQLESTDPATVQHAAMRVQQLAEEGNTWVARRDGILQEALAGARSDVVMPARWRTTLDSAGNATAVPQGKWKAVEPEVAFRRAGDAAQAGQENTRMLADLKGAVSAIRGAQGDPTLLGESLSRILRTAHPDATDQEIKTLVAQMTTQGPGGKWLMTKQGDQLVGSLQKALATEDRRIKQELDAASKLAEKYTRNGTNGLIPGPMYHGTSMPFEGGTPSRITTEGHTLENLDGPGLYTTTDQTGRITTGMPRLAENEMNRGYAVPERAGARSAAEPTVYTFAPKDPSSRLLPVSGQIHPDDLSPETLAKIDEFHGGDGWMFANDGGPDPILEFLAHDAATFAEDPQLFDELMQYDNFGEMYQHLRQHYESALSQVEGVDTSAINSLTAHTITLNSQPAADAVHMYTDHLYEDLGIKGLTREGGLNTRVANPVTHQHNIWFRPNEDLEMVGKADFSAAFAEKQVRELAKERGYFSDVLRSQDELAQQLADRERDLAKYGKDVGAVKASPATRRAQDNVQFALDQQARAEQYMNDTVDGIKARRAGHMAELRKVRAFLDSGAKVSPEMRASMEAYVADLHQSVLWGHAHEQALTLADNQLRRVAALEQSAAETRAAMADLHFQGVELQREMASLDARTIERLSEAVRSGLQVEIKRGVGTPQDVADMLLRTERFVPPDGMRGFLKRYDQVVQWMKSWQIATPGFHVRNGFGNAWQNELAGIDHMSYPEWFKISSRMARGKGATLTQAQRDSYDTILKIVGRGQTTVEGRGAANLWEGGVRGSDRLAELGADAKKGTLLPSRNNYYVRALRHVGEDVEFYFRGALAHDALKKGMSPEEAAALVRKFHFDYQDLTSFEQALRHVIPFYTFARKNLPLQVEMLLHKPAVFNRFFIVKDNIERQSTPDSVVPSYWSMAIRLPWMKGGGHTYWAPDLPMRDLQEWQDPKTKVFGSLTPVVKTPIEMWANKQVYKDIPLRNDKWVPVPLPGLVVKGVGPALEALGVAKMRDGHLMMTEKNAYVLEQNIPIIARYRRMLPEEEKYQQRHMTTILSFLGLGTKTNSLLEQQQYARNRHIGSQIKEQNRKKSNRNLQRAVNALENGNG